MKPKKHKFLEFEETWKVSRNKMSNASLLTKEVHIYKKTLVEQDKMKRQSGEHGGNSFKSTMRRMGSSPKQSGIWVVVQVYLLINGRKSSPVVSWELEDRYEHWNNYEWCLQRGKKKVTEQTLISLSVEFSFRLARERS